jgi:hypothetical protein
MNNRFFFQNKILKNNLQIADNQLFVNYFFDKKTNKNSLIKCLINSFLKRKINLKIAVYILPFIFLFLGDPSVYGQKNAKLSSKKDPKFQGIFNGSWSGKGTVDYGFGSRTEFEYELILEQKKDGTVTGVSVTYLHIDGKRYCAKALVEGKATKNYLNCAEKYNITEDKLPDSGWIPFVKMELILKNDGATPTLQGVYECSDKSNGRIILTKKPPQV